MKKMLKLALVLVLAALAPAALAPTASAVSSIEYPDNIDAYLEMMGLDPETGEWTGGGIDSVDVWTLLPGELGPNPCAQEPGCSDDGSGATCEQDSSCIRLVDEDGDYITVGFAIIHPGIYHGGEGGETDWQEVQVPAGWGDSAETLGYCFDYPGDAICEGTP